MKLEGKTAIITGGGSGIGRATAKRFAKAGANVVIGDISEEKAKAVARETGGIGIACDVTREKDIQSLVEQAEKAFGRIDLFFSNAGVAFGEPDHAASAANETWQKCWDIHVMSHVYAARTVLPGMIERGEGYLLQMASAAGLLNQIGDAAYSATKHAAVGFAEALAITHREDGIKVSVVCPQYVATPLLGYEDQTGNAEGEGTLTVEEVAGIVMAGVEAEEFLILTHPEVLKFMQNKSGDYERWISGMQKLRAGMIAQLGKDNLLNMHKLF